MLDPSKHPLTMSTNTKTPDFAGIAERLAKAEHPCDMYHALTMGPLRSGPQESAMKAYASCMEVRLRSDWETIRLLRAVSHPPPCDFDLPFSPPIECTCGLSAHLSKLLEPFTP